jgi:GNAT superfamily N-acetyltransferase
MDGRITISSAVSQADLAAIRALLADYAGSLSVDLAYQGFAQELAGLPGAYDPPAGALLVARNAQGAAYGCVALRRITPAIAEMKRLYVAPAARGGGLGRKLAQAVLAEARRLGYRTIVLDTLPDMKDARSLYAQLGFEPIAPYYDTPVEGTVFLALDLQAEAGTRDAAR